jgi:hypothetical protein
MRKFGLSLAIVAAISLAAIHDSAAAQGRGGAHGNKPATTGIEHAETKANTNGVNHGLDNAESKQATHKNTDPGKAKGKRKHHKHGK